MGFEQELRVGERRRGRSHEVRTLRIGRSVPEDGRHPSFADQIPLKVVVAGPGFLHDAIWIVRDRYPLSSAVVVRTGGQGEGKDSGVSEKELRRCDRDHRGQHPAGAAG